jgi:hypothetical protein
LTDCAPHGLNRCSPPDAPKPATIGPSAAEIKLAPARIRGLRGDQAKPDNGAWPAAYALVACEFHQHCMSGMDMCGGRIVRGRRISNADLLKTRDPRSRMESGPHDRK